MKFLTSNNGYWIAVCALLLSFTSVQHVQAQLADVNISFQQAARCADTDGGHCRSGGELLLLLEATSTVDANSLAGQINIGFVPTIHFPDGRSENMPPVTMSLVSATVGGINILEVLDDLSSDLFNVGVNEYAFLINWPCPFDGTDGAYNITLRPKQVTSTFPLGGVRFNFTDGSTTASEVIVAGDTQFDEANLDYNCGTSAYVTPLGGAGINGPDAVLPNKDYILGVDRVHDVFNVEWIHDGVVYLPMDGNLDFICAPPISDVGGSSEFIVLLNNFLCPSEFGRYIKTVIGSNNGYHGDECGPYKNLPSQIEEEVAVYPNPATYFLSFSRNLENVELSVVDIHGQVMIQKGNFSGKTINLDLLTSGLYSIVVKNAENDLVISKAFTIVN